MTYEPEKGFIQEVTCPFNGCKQKTKGHKTARGTIVCHWCGKVFEDKEREIDLFPEIERRKKYKT